MRYVILFFLCCVNVQAQNPHQYYPHHVGDMWQWVDEEARISTEKILRDSVNEDGNTFVNTSDISGFAMFYWHWKFNSTGDTVYQYPNANNYLTYKFPMDTGDVWLVNSEQGWPYAKVLDKLDTVVLGRSTTVFHIAYYPDTSWNQWLWHEYYAYGIGTIWQGDRTSHKVLIGCTIDGIKLTVLDMDKTDFQPNEFELSQNYPNPFNPETKIKFNTSRPGLVNLTVYDMLGREVETLVNEYRNSGTYETTFNSKYLASGIYIYRLRAGDNVLSKKMILMK